MNPVIRDSLLRLSSGSDFQNVMTYVKEMRSATVEGLVGIDPNEQINMARLQGRINGYDQVTNLVNEAETALEDKGTNNG